MYNQEPTSEAPPTGDPPATAFATANAVAKGGAIEAAIGALTRAIGVASDDVIPSLVSERAALRAELRALRETAAGVARLDSRRKGGS